VDSVLHCRPALLHYTQAGDLRSIEDLSFFQVKNIRRTVVLAAADGLKVGTIRVNDSDARDHDQTNRRMAEDGRALSLRT
jgi:hypothetical protein